jgi:predicted dehydrogenase
MTRKVITVALNGVTGRMGYRQHLVRSLLSIRDQGGVLLGDGTAVFPEPILVGRSEDRLRDIAERHGLERWSASLDEVLGDPAVDVYFDAQVTSAREASLASAIAAGKHVYTEKPVAGSLDGAMRLARAAGQAGITHGVVQDKLFLPGMIKLRRLVDSGFFGRVLGQASCWLVRRHASRPRRRNSAHSDAAGSPCSPHWHPPDELFLRRRGSRPSHHVLARRDESGTRRPLTTPPTRCWSSPLARSRR